MLNKTLQYSIHVPTISILTHSNKKNVVIMAKSRNFLLLVRVVIFEGSWGCQTHF